ncbi:B-cell CLL/lymphoma 9 protein isoform X2 [Mixophyes fleayi]|uniref:B-cell CLL/lymphoma 9 protein isoform X2 n=1 Tax=Mixophyes fleayi TaxID=3061075 RepID=UPI003F4D8BEF
MLELQEGRTHFNKKERNKKEKDEQKDSADKGTSQKAHLKTPSPPKNLASPTASVTASSGSLSMHSSNAKVRNSPSGNTQSSPKAKPEVMVHPPSVMSPSGNPQLDAKFSSQGKQGGSASQSQASPCDPKSGNHTPKPLQGPGGSMGLKNGAGNGAKGKGKRERSISAESFDQRDPGTPTTDSENKDSNTTDPGMPLECHAPHPMPPSNSSVPRSSTPSHGPTMLDSAPGRKTPTKVVYVFSTEMANKAAEAIMKGQAESIVLFHIQSTSNSKAERTSTPTNTQISTNIRNEPKANPRAPTPQEQNHSQAAKVQSNTAGPALPSKPAASHCSLGQDGGVVEGKIAVSSPANSSVLQTDGCRQSSTPNNQAASPMSQGNVAPPVDPKVELTKSALQQLSSADQASLGENPDGLSQEQLEHRERSLQTLRDIQRMLFPDEKEFAIKDITGQSGGPQQNSGMLDNPQKKLEGPIQAMMAQSQNLGKGPGPHPDGGMPFGPQGHRDMPFSPEDMVPPPMNPQPGQDHLDHMSPEQVAWLKLQQEFYEEKRRKQEQVVVQQRSLQDMMVHQHGPRGMVRGPPPPYQMNPGESWGPGGPEPFPDGIGMPHPMPPKGMPPHPNVPGSQMQRLPGFVGMMNPDMEGPNIPNPASRPGVNWPDEVPKIPDGRNFPPGQSIFSGPGRGERFPNPQGLPDEIFHQHVSEKQLGMPPGIGMEGIRPVMEINRGMPPQRNMEPGGGLFPRMPGDAALSPSRMEFSKGMPLNIGPNREVEFGMGPGNMNMKVDMNLNVNMNSNQQLMTQKMREMRDVMASEEMLKLRTGSNEMLSNQQKMHSAPFEHSQQEYGMGSRPYLNMSQATGGVLRNPREHMGPDQRTNSRLSHMPPLPLNPNNNPGNLNVAPPGQRSLGRKPLDNVSVSGNQVNSPGVNPLKSPTMRQVQSPMLGSPSGNLKSPQTPSQLAGMLTGPTAAAAASIKSPPVMGSAAASPVHLKSPSLPVPSPGWTSSPKPPMQSPGIPPNQHKPPLGISSPAMMGNMESGMVMNPQNPSKMSGPHGGVSMPTLSPMGMTQPLSHGGQMPSPNAMPPNVQPHGGPMGGGMMPHNAMMAHGSQDNPMVPQGRMAFAQGFPPVQSPPQVPFPHNGPNGGQGNFPPGMGFPGDGHLSRPGNLPPNADPALCKSGCPTGPDSFIVMGNNMPSVFTDPDLQEVIRPGASGIPEFDLSRIIPSEKPSQTLQYFPRGEVPGRKPQQGPGFSHLPGMMGEPNPRMGLPMGGMGGPGPVDMPGHNSMRPPGFMQQGMIGPHHRMMSPAQSGMPGQLTMMGNPGGVGMMGKERMAGVLYSHPGPVGSPNMLMSMQGMMGPQQNLMIPPQMRPRGMPTDVGMGGFSQGPGNPGNMMF